MKIANQYITATFKSKGAELTSLKKNGMEYLWQGNPKHWGRHAPVLFPFVGKLKKDRFQYNGGVYEMGQHGFARDYEFELSEHNGDSISFQLKSSEQTLKIYPFQFSLSITYLLVGSAIKVTYAVYNAGKSEMYFSIGGHPAFNCPMTSQEQRSDYWLEFDQSESLETHLLDGGLFSGETEPIRLNDKKLKISDELFDKDALVFKSLKSQSVDLVSPSKKWLTFRFEGFPYLGVWSKNPESTFVCIEPWYGLAGSEKGSVDLTDKEGIQNLASKETFVCSYLAELH
ncbi:MAG: aldose 1-epimerase family protein [Marinoscillum sp.]